MRKSILGLAMGAFMGFGLAGHAQVQYKIEWRQELEAFQVSLVPQATWDGPMGITASGQISMKAPAGALDVVNVKNLIVGANFEMNAKYETPSEATGHDYFSFGLISLGTNTIPYQSGEEVPLFTFQNGVDCTGKIELVDNASDPFMPPNSAKANIGNQLTVFGANGNAYAGNLVPSAECSALVLANHETVAGSKFELYPTNASQEVNVSFTAKEADQHAEFRVLDQSGRVVETYRPGVSEGKNLVKLDITKLRTGAFMLELRSKNSTNTIGRFFKAGA